MTEPVEHEHQVFSEKRVDSISVITLKEYALDLLTDMELREDYIGLFSRIEQKDRIFVCIFSESLREHLGASLRM